MAGYNRTRHVEELLERTESLPPSFTVHLHPEYWTLNNGSKFLYNNQIAVRLVHSLSSANLHSALVAVGRYTSTSHTGGLSRALRFCAGAVL